MAATSTEVQEASVLRVLGRAGGGRCSAGELKKKLGAEAGADDRAIEALIGAGLVAVTGGSKGGPHPRPNASYRLTDAGRDRNRPARPDHPDEQLQTQEAFVLLQVFRSRDQALTRSDLNTKLKTNAAVRQLEFDVKGTPGTVDYHLAALVAKGALAEHRRSNSVFYTLDPDRGPAALAAAKQHEAVSFTLTGATLNALLAAARAAAPARIVDIEADGPTEIEPPVNGPETARPRPTVGPDEILDYVKRLGADRYAGKDLIPIHEVRRLVAQEHGDAAAGHPALDPILKEMRSEGQLRMIAISDNRDATQQQLDDSIPGMNEIIYYIVIR